MKIIRYERISGLREHADWMQEKARVVNTPENLFLAITPNQDAILNTRKPLGDWRFSCVLCVLCYNKFTECVVGEKMKFELNEYHRDISNDVLLNDVRSVASALHRDSLTQQGYKENGGKFGLQTFRRRFGSWNKVLELCGISISGRQFAASKSTHKYKSISSEDLIADIRRVANMHNTVTLNSKVYSQSGEFSVTACSKRFGSWDKALIVAGLSPNKDVPGKRIVDADMLYEIERIWIQLGRQPTSTDINRGISKYSLHAYTSHFGSWRKALETFVDYISSDTHDNNSEERQLQHREQSTNIQTKLNQDLHSTHREVNLRLRFLVMQRDNFKCCICGASPAKDPLVVLHIDHVVPWSKGGETTMDNIQTLCSKCNLGKSDLEI